MSRIDTREHADGAVIVTSGGRHLDLGCCFINSLDTPDHITRAEELGYCRAWIADSPAVALEPWITLARAAERTHRIGLATGVLIPRLRHLMATAIAIATMAHLAPGRFWLGVGAGFTGLRALGERAMRWSEVAEYVEALRTVLRGDVAEWGGSPMRLMQPPQLLPRMPIEIPVIFAADGPKGFAAAQDHADGVITVVADPPAFDRSARVVCGTVLADGESPTSDRAWDAAAPGAALIYHAAYEHGWDMSGLPNGDAYRDATDALAVEERHLLLHEGHMTTVSDHDARLIPREAVPALTFTGTVDDLRARSEELADKGISELVVLPAGSDVTRELDAFARLATPSSTRSTGA